MQKRGPRSGGRGVTADNERLRSRCNALEEALIWCSGAADFAFGGKAHDGWVKMCEPLLDPDALLNKEPTCPGCGNQAR